MGDKRMLNIKIVQATNFLKMPISSQYLYFQLAVSCDDDGIVEAFNIMRLCNCNEDDLKILEAKQYIKILNDDLISYVIHFKLHNTLRADRKKDSIYKHLLIEILPDVKLIESKERADRKKIVDKSHEPHSTDNGNEEIKEIKEKNILKKTTESKNLTPEINYQIIVDSFNNICVNLSKVTKLTEKRKKIINKFIKINPDFDFKSYFEKVNSNKFLTGNNDRGWRTDFEWILDINKSVNIIEGKYDYTPKPQYKEVKKPVQATNYEQREYDDSYYYSLYDNISAEDAKEINKIK